MSVLDWAGDVESVPTFTLKELAQKYGLKLRVNERPLAPGHPDRYYVSFEHVEVIEPGVLVGAYGNGATPDTAAAAYVEEISLRRLAVDAWTDKRRDIGPFRVVGVE